MKKTFKYLSYAIIYLLISLASAYGVITLSINNSNRLSSKGDSSKPSPAPSLPTQLTKVVDNFSQSEYIGFNFSADIKTSFDNFCILVEANIDLSQGIEKIKVDGSINAEIESKNQYYNIDFGYQNETAYFDLFNGKLSIDTKNILKPVNQILNLLEIEMPDIVGVLGEMDLDTILGFFSNLKEEADPADPEKLNLLITLPMIEQVMTIVCDKEYKVDALLFNFVSDDINANIKANFTYPENVEIENKNNEEYVKVNSLLDVVTGTINYIKTNENFAFDIALEYDEYDVSGKLYINPEKQEGKISLNIAENIVNLIYIDKTIYIEYENVYFKFNFNEYAKVCDFIENTFGINLPVEDIINLLNNFNKEDLLKLLSDFGLDMSEIEFNDLSILEKVYIENETTFIKLKDIGTISIGIKDEKFSSIGFTGQNTNISLNTTTYKNINLNVDENNYINIVDILPTLQNGIDIFKANSLSGTLLIDYKEYSLPVDLILSLKDGYAKLSTQINSYNLIIEKVNNKVYINFADKMKVIVNLDNFIDEIIEFLSDINYDIDLSEITDSLKDLNNIFAPQSSPLLFKEFTKTENGIEITLFNDMTIKIVNGCKQITISSGFENINFSASIIASDETIEIPNFNDEEYTKVEDVLDLAKVVINSGIIQAVEGSINYFAQKTIALDFNVDYADAVAKGQIFIDIENLRLFLNAEMSGKKFNIALEKNIVYLEYKNIFVKFDIFDTPIVFEMLNREFGLNLPVEFTTKLLSAVQSGKIENVVDTIKDEFNIDINLDEVKFDISKIDKTFFENIIVDGNKTIIPYGDKTITLEVTDKMLTKFDFNGLGIDLKTSTIEYKENVLSANKENYINIVDILPTLQNGIDIFKANSLSGTLLIDYKEYSLPVDLILSLKDGYAKLSTQINSYNLIIEKVNNKVYINFADKMKVIVNLDNFIDEIIEFLSDINYDIDLSEITDSLKDLNNIFAPQSSPLLFKEFTKTENGIEITLFNDMTIKIVNGCKQITISSGFENINFSASIIASDETIEIPNFNDEEYTKVEDVLDLAKVVINSGIIQAVEGSINYFAQKTIALDFNVDYADAVAKGQIFIDIENLRLFLNAEMSGKKFNIALEKNIVYLEYKNIFVKFDIFDTPIVFEMLNREFGLNLPVEFTTKLLSAVQSGKIENVVDTIKDEFNIDINLDEVKFDISKIDKTFFENIIVDGNKTIIPYGDKTITLEVTDKMLTKFDFNGLGIDLKTSTIEYKENVLSANKENYINIVDILPTLQNVLDIVKSDSIFGNLNVKSQELEIPVVFKVDKKSDNIYAEFIATVYQGVISIYYDNNKVYINIFDQIKLVSDLEELPSAVEELTDGLDTLINPILDLIGISKKVVDSFEENDNATPLFSSFIKTENGLEMIVNGINIKLTNDLKQLLISANIDTLEFNGSIIGNDEIIERATFGEEYIDIEKIFRLVNSAKNMSKREDFHVKGFVDLKLGTLALDTVEFDIYIKVVDKKIQLIVEFPNIPTIPFVTKGLFENVKDRSTKIYFHDDTIYMLRKETKDNKLHQQTIKLSPNSFTSDIYTYIQFAFGFTDTIMEQIRKPAEKYREGDTINLNNVLRNFAIVEETNNSQTRYDLTLNLAEIADNKVLGDLSLRLYIGENENGESYIQELGMNMAVLGGFVNLATPLQNNQDDKTKTIKIVDYGKNIDDKMQELYDYDSSYTFAYDTMMEKTGDGEWTKMSEVLRTITFETNCDTVLPQISAPFKTEITIPTLETIILDDGVTKTIKTFAGWFSSENFEPESLFTSKTMPQSDVTLFAKWDNEVLKYSTINFVTNSSETLDPITALEGEKISIPTLNNKQVVAEDGKTVSTYRFDGWYLDENTTTRFDNFAMPNVDTLLYAKWTLVSVEHSSLLSIYDNDNLIYSIYLPSGKDIDLSGLSNINENTKFYLDSGYMNVFNGSLIMPEYDLSLHVRNKYTLSIKSEFGNAIESITTFWQGQSFTVPTQEDYYVDDGTRTQRDFYFFRGYSVNGVICDIPSIMPNQNTEIVAVWEKETKFYYTVSFDMRWYKVDGCGPAHKLKVEADPIAPIVLLEGSVLDLSIYQPTCIAQKTLIYNNVTYKATSWGTSAWANGTKGGSGVTSIEITSNTTLYACWQEQ